MYPTDYHFDISDIALSKVKFTNFSSIYNSDTVNVIDDICEDTVNVSKEDGINAYDALWFVGAMFIDDDIASEIYHKLETYGHDGRVICSRLLYNYFKNYTFDHYYQIEYHFPKTDKVEPNCHVDFKLYKITRRILPAFETEPGDHKWPFSVNDSMGIVKLIYTCTYEFNGIENGYTWKVNEPDNVKDYISNPEAMDEIMTFLRCMDVLKKIEDSDDSEIDEMYNDNDECNKW